MEAEESKPSGQGGIFTTISNSIFTASKSEAAKAEAAKPDEVKPEVVKPEVVKPEVVKPEVVKPEVVKPEVVKPEVVAAVKPEAAKPEASKPKEVKTQEAKPQETRSLINTITSAISPKEAGEESEPDDAPEERAQVDAPKKVRKPREIKPTDSKSFFKARAKEVGRFQFTAEGDLRVPSLGGEEAKIIPLPFYSPATADEVGVIDSKRREEIQQVEQEYDELCKQLSTAMDEWKSSGDFIDAVRLQKEILALDSRRTSLRSPLRWGKIIKNPTIKTVQLHETAVVDEKQKDLKLGYPVMTLVGRPYTFEQLVLPRKEKPKVEVPVEPVETTEQTFILFDRPEDPEYGLLSPETPLEFVFNTTKYNSIMQAYHVERVTQVGRTDMRATLLKLVNPKSIRSIGSRIVGKEAKEVEAPFQLINDIVKTVVLQDARYAPLLRKTGMDTLIYAEPQDKILGVGVSINDEATATNSTRWNGALNLLGKAWEQVRKSLPPEDETTQKGGAYLESGKTIQDVKQARSKVLMGYYRRK
jgi:predicted NAD-dependent protein-ADP-ribosyltransferase YbiA (DUF1768 family)